jgi:two-component sensor histidine kinase
VSTLSDVLRGTTDLPEQDVSHLSALAGEWGMLADLSFADLLLFVPLRSRSRLRQDAEFLVAAQVRPVTGSTLYSHDEVGRRVRGADRPAVAAAMTEGRIVRQQQPRDERDVPVHEEAIPVRRGGRVLAVVSRESSVAAARVLGALEQAYLRTAGELAVMVSEGTFPLPGTGPDPTDAPRVGDGLLRLDPAGQVLYASPNALSAYRRLGYRGDLTGEELRAVHATFALAVPAAGAAAAPARAGPGAPEQIPVWEAASRVVLAEDELVADGGAVLLRGVPLLPGGRVIGSVVLVRDVTDLRRREAQLKGKDTTIREIHHRVKNNLQTVAALLRLQSRRVDVPEARLALLEAVRRVTSIALVHETLSQNVSEEVSFDAVADELIAMTLDVVATRERPVTSRTGSFGHLPGGVATPLALVLTELIQNAVEHAFDGSGGRIEVRVRRPERGGLELVVADDGTGLPADFAPERNTRLGLQIVRALVVGEMGGTFALRRAPGRGTEAVVALPARW